MPTTYASPMAGLPDQTALHTGRAVFTEAYAVIPHGVMRDIVTSYLPHWKDTRAWVIARPMTGFSETFSQYIVEVSPGGGSERPEPDAGAEGGGPHHVHRADEPVLRHHLPRRRHQQAEPRLALGQEALEGGHHPGFDGAH